MGNRAAAAYKAGTEEEMMMTIISNLHFNSTVLLMDCVHIGILFVYLIRFLSSPVRIIR